MTNETPSPKMEYKTAAQEKLKSESLASIPGLLISWMILIVLKMLERAAIASDAETLSFMIGIPILFCAVYNMLLIFSTVGYYLFDIIGMYAPRNMYVKDYAPVKIADSAMFSRFILKELI